jgi:hypothetical protein
VKYSVTGAERHEGAGTARCREQITEAESSAVRRGCYTAGAGEICRSLSLVVTTALPKLLRRELQMSARLWRAVEISTQVSLCNAIAVAL